MPYIMAIDQGSTKTDVIIADHSGVIAGKGDDRDRKVVSGERRAARMIRIRYAAEKALADAGLEFLDIDNVSACCTGADWKFEYEIGKRNLQNTLGVQKVRLYNDCIGALRGGTEIKGRDCAVICLGTGANCAVINREGEEYIYAYYLKDIHQGASAIGKHIFQAVYDAESGLGPETLMIKLLLEKTGYQSVDELFMSVTTGRSETETSWEPAYQNYSPLLFEAISRGDKAAKEYLEWLGRELAQYVYVAALKLKMEKREITVVISGGVPKSGSLMGEIIERQLKKDLPGVKCLSARFEPVAGALLLEYDRLFPNGIPEETKRRFEQSCAERGLFRTFSQQEA